MSDVLKVDDSAETLMGEIVDEFTQRLERGEDPEIEEYALRHPRLATVLRQMLPALALLRSGAAVGSVVDAASGDELAPERPLGDYRLVREVGRGGMGVVYEATQLSLGRRVALKVLPFAAALDAKHLQRFKNEAQAAAHLHHKSIVPVHGVGCDRGIHYYAMQFIEGHTLAEVISDLRLQILDLPDGSVPSAPSVAGAEVLRSPGLSAGSSENAHGEAHAGASEYLSPGHVTQHATRHVAQHETQPSSNLKSTICNLKSPLTEQAAIGPAYFRAVANLIIQAAEALDCAHEEGVVHRDIKPANLMVDMRGNLWITDFGLAHCQSQAGLTMSGDLVGTLRYMSPEQALAKRVLIDHRTDVYSLGATLYELLTLEPVFPGADRQELLRQIAFEEPKPLRRHNKAIPSELETIVMKALEKNPADRYAIAKELAEDLERFVKDEPIRAKRPSLARRGKQWCRRRRPLVASFVTVILLGIGALAWQERQRGITAQAVASDLKEAEALEKQKLWAQATPALERAKGRLSGSGLSALEANVDQRLRDAAMAVRLEKASLPGDDSSWFQEDVYRSAFVKYGLDVTKLPPSEAAQHIKASAISSLLVRALDRWAVQADVSEDGTGATLREIAQLVDNDPWRRRLRDPKIFKNREELKRLAQGEEVLSQPPESAWILCLRLEATSRPGIRVGHGAGPLGAADPGVVMLRKVQALHPSDFGINYVLGFHLSDETSAADAVGFYRAALSAQPRSVPTLLNLIVALEAAGKHDDATALMRKASDLTPNKARAYELIGHELKRIGKLSEAEEAYRKAITINPASLDANSQLAGWLAEIDRFPEAVELFSKLFEIEPDYAAAWVSLGGLYWDRQKLPEAIEAYQKAIATKVRNAPVNASWGNVYWSAWFNIGALLQKQRRFPEAVEAFRKSIDEAGTSKSVNADRAASYNQMGVAQRSQQKLSEAIASFRKVIDLQPDFADAHTNLFLVLYRDGKFTQAVTAYTRAVEQNANAFGNAVLFPAVYAAVLASDGRAAAVNLSATERAQYRKRALDWLGAFIVDANARLTSNPGRESVIILQTMDDWKRIDPDLTPNPGMEALAKLSQSGPEWRKLCEDLDELRKRVTPRGFMQSWLVLSELVPYDGANGAKALDLQPIPGEGLLRTRAGDQVEVSGKTLMWKEHHGAEPYIDFARGLRGPKAVYGTPSEYRLAYAVCYVRADADRTDLVLRVGSAAQAMVYVNGEEVYRQTKARALKLDEDEVRPIRLRKGTNVLVFKVVNQSDPSPFGSLHLVTKDGAVPEGIEYRLEP